MPLRSVNQLESYEFRRERFDVRGWEARSGVDEAKAGKVHDVLVDETDEPRYLDIDLGAFSKHVLVPVGHAALDRAEDVVWIAGMSKDQLRDIPEYEHELDAPPAEYEERLNSSYGAAFAGPAYYDRPEYGVAEPAGTAGDAPLLGNEEGRIRSLNELEDYEVSDEDPDPRGWDVVSADGQRIGRVEDLAVDTQAMKARYLDVGIAEREERALIPVGFAQLDENEQVLLSSIPAAEVRTLPAYTSGYDREYEERVRDHFEKCHRDDRRYSHPRYAAERLYAPRELTAGPRGHGSPRVCDVRITR